MERKVRLRGLVDKVLVYDTWESTEEDEWV